VAPKQEAQYIRAELRDSLVGYAIRREAFLRRSSCSRAFDLSAGYSMPEPAGHAYMQGPRCVG
jgi:hypothetical protein